MRVLIAGVSISSVLAVAGYCLGLSYFASRPETFARGTGGAPSAPALALMILLALPWMGYRLSVAKSRFTRSMYAALILVNMLALVTTYSRGGAIVLVFLLAGLAWDYRRSLTPRRVGALLGGGMLLIPVFFLLIPSSYWERQRSVLDGDDFSIGRRMSYLQVAAGAFVTHPLLGSGPGTFSDYYARSPQALEFSRKSEETSERRAHNTYVEVLVGNGVIGLAVFLLLLSAAWMNFRRAVRIADQLCDPPFAALARAFRLSYLVLLIYLLIYSNVDNKYLVLLLAVSESIRWEAARRYAVLEETA